MADYQSDDLIYFDPSKKLVVGKVEFDKNGAPIKKVREFSDDSVADDDDDSDAKPKKGGKGRPPRRARRKEYYPWATYKSARKLYGIDGKVIEPDVVRPFDDALRLALKEPYWDEPPPDTGEVKTKEAETY